MITVEKTIDFLNELLEIDREGITDLFNNREACNVNMSQHPTVQVYAKDDDDRRRYYFGVLGLINGLFGDSDNGWGHIAAVYNDETRLIDKFVTKNEYDYIESEKMVEGFKTTAQNSTVMTGKKDINLF